MIIDEWLALPPPGPIHTQQFSQYNPSLANLVKMSFGALWDSIIDEKVYFDTDDTDDSKRGNTAEAHDGDATVKQDPCPKRAGPSSAKRLSLSEIIQSLESSLLIHLGLWLPLGVHLIFKGLGQVLRGDLMGTLMAVFGLGMLFWSLFTTLMVNEGYVSLSKWLSSRSKNFVFVQSDKRHWSEQVAVVTGGMGGLGMKLVEEMFDKRGCKSVVIIDRPITQSEVNICELLGQKFSGIQIDSFCDIVTGTYKKLNSVNKKGEVHSPNEKESCLYFYPLDLSKPMEWDPRDVVKQIETQVGCEITIWINNAGVNMKSPALPSLNHDKTPSTHSLSAPKRQTFSHYDSQMTTFSVNYLAPALLSNVILELFCLRKYGNLVSVASVLGEVGVGGGQSAYCASKSAMIGWYECVKQEILDRSSLLSSCIDNMDSGVPSNLRLDSQPLLVQHHLIKPGLILTPLFNGIRMRFGWINRPLMASEIASQIINTLDRGMNVGWWELKTYGSGQNLKANQLTKLYDFLARILRNKLITALYLHTNQYQILTSPRSYRIINNWLFGFFNGFQGGWVPLDYLKHITGANKAW